MKLTEINIRDPFIVLDRGKYYMYGTCATECWRGKAHGLDAYVSDDLEDWSGPYLVFDPPKDFWSDRQYWAPEMHIYKGRYYIFVSFVSDTRLRGTQILSSDSPLGPFTVHSPEPITPPDWQCLDGTFYIDKKGKPYMVFCHEWSQIGDGTICAVELTEDLKYPAGEPFLLFAASEAEWICSVTDKEGDYVTDGPFMYRDDKGDLYMLWAGDAKIGYAQGIAKSDNGDIDGKWSQIGLLIDDFSGGHGMIFTTKEGVKKFTMHSPDKTPKERPYIFDLIEVDGNPKAVISK